MYPLDRSNSPKAFVVVSRSETRLVLKVSRGAVIRRVGLCLFASLFSAIGPTILSWLHGGDFPGRLAYVGYAAAVLLGLAALWFLRQAAVHLVVGRNGHIQYGRRTLCAAGGVQSIVVRSTKTPDDTRFDVFIQTQDGRCLELPYYMSTFSSQEEADELAEELSDYLGVARVDTTSAGLLPRLVGLLGARGGCSRCNDAACDQPRVEEPPSEHGPRDGA